MLTQYSLIKNGQLVEFKFPLISISHLLDFYAKKFPYKEAVIHLEDNQKTVFSYKQLKEIVGKTSAYLIKKLNMKKNKRIAFLMKNSPEILFLNFACWSSSLITVPLDSKRDSLDSIIYKIKQTKSKALFIKTDAIDKTIEAELNRVIKHSKTKIKIIKFNSLKDFLKLIEEENPLNLNSSIKNDALILYTSGTTAFPRGALLTVENLLSNADSIADWLNFKENDRFMTILPLHHINSTTFVLSAFLRGGTIILTPGYSNSGFFPSLAETEATITSIVPTICHDQLAQKEIFDKIRHKLKVSRIQIGSAPVQPLEAEEFTKKFGIPLIQGYGQTETSLRSTGMPYKENENEAILNSSYFEFLRSNTIGTEMKWTNVTVLLPDGKDAKKGEEGELCVRGPGIMKEYIEDKKETKKAFKFNWFHSGDLGYYRIINGNKFFFIKGRVKEIIIKGGINISPLAVELALKKAYPKIDQVYVIGYEDRRFGEEIGVAVVFRGNTSKENRNKIIKSIIKDGQDGKIKNLSRYESPRQVIEISPNELPMTSTGKVQRTKIKEIFPKLAGLHSKDKEKRIIARNHSLIFRQIFPYEREIIKKAVEINNRRWHPLIATENEFTERSKNSLLIGAFDFNNNLLGTISALRTNNINALKKTTWEKLTASGTLSTNKPNGKTLVCVAISTLGKENRSDNHSHKKSKVSNKLLQKLADKYLDSYLKSNLDPIVRFHKKPKAGFKKGAKLIDVIKEGRITDKDAQGYNILFAYPEITNKTKLSFSKNESVGTQLIEAALMLAQQLSINKVLAFSRPAGLRSYLEEKINN